MLTELGKYLRKLRIDQGINMMQLAGSMGLSTAMLSAIETGRKKVPSDFIDKLINVFADLTSERFKLEALMNLANNEVRLPLVKASAEDALLVTELARRFSDLSDAEKEGLRGFLAKAGQQ